MEALEKITSAIGKKLEGRKPSLDRTIIYGMLPYFCRL